MQAELKSKVKAARHLGVGESFSKRFPIEVDIILHNRRSVLLSAFLVNNLSGLLSTVTSQLKPDLDTSCMAVTRLHVCAPVWVETHYCVCGLSPNACLTSAHPGALLPRAQAMCRCHRPWKCASPPPASTPTRRPACIFPYDNRSSTAAHTARHVSVCASSV